VFIPLLTSPLNTGDWPECVREEIKMRVNDLRDTVVQIKGQVYGETILPLPSIADKVEEEEQRIIQR
jgi:dynein heavy chain